jgi:MFS family permease
MRPQSQAEAKGDLRKVLILAAGVVFLDTFFLSILAPLLPTYKSDLGLNDAQVGLLSGAFAWGSVLGALPAGFLAQRFGPRRVVLAGLLALSAAGVALGWVAQIGLLDLARLAQGCAAAAVWIGGFTWLIAATPLDRRGSAIGIAVLGGAVGPLVGPAVGALSAATDTHWTFTATLVLTLPLAAFVRAMKEPVRFRPQPVREVSAAIFSRPVIRAFVFLGVPTLGFGFVSVLLPLKIDALGGGANLIAIAVIVAGALEALLAPVAGSWSDRRGRREPYLFGLLAYCAGLVAMAATGSALACAVAFLLAALGGGLFIVPSFAIFSDAADRSGLAQSHGFALSSTAFSLGFAGGALAGGAISNAAGTTSAYLVIVAVLLLLALYAWRGTRRSPATAQQKAINLNF